MNDESFINSTKPLTSSQITYYSKQVTGFPTDTVKTVLQPVICKIFVISKNLKQLNFDKEQPPSDMVDIYFFLPYLLSNFLSHIFLPSTRFTDSYSLMTYGWSSKRIFTCVGEKERVNRTDC